MISCINKYIFLIFLIARHPSNDLLFQILYFQTYISRIFLFRATIPVSSPPRSSVPHQRRENARAPENKKEGKEGEENVGER